MHVKVNDTARAPNSMKSYRHSRLQHVCFFFLFFFHFMKYCWKATLLLSHVKITLSATTRAERLFGVAFLAQLSSKCKGFDGALVCRTPMSSKSGGQEKLSCFLGVVSQETLARPVMAVAINQDGGRESGFTCMDRWCKQRDPKNDDGTPAHHEQLHFSKCVETFLTCSAFVLITVHRQLSSIQKSTSKLVDLIKLLFFYRFPSPTYYT